MKKVFYLFAAVSVLSLAACKSSQNAYKQAYEKAVANDTPAAVEAPVRELSENPGAPAADDAANVSVREEKVTVVTGDASIRDYGIVCGSFSLKTNADALRQRLIEDGYPAVVVVNEAGKTYRVICQSFTSKQEAVDARAKFKARYPDNKDFQAAWILYKK